jgi:methyl-accepting chemotaxis protein
VGRSSELDEFLSRAVDRQMAEQRALREALNDLRRAVEALATRQPDAPPVLVDDRTHLEIASLRREIAELRALVSVPTPIAEPADIDLGPLRDDLTTVNANIDGIAQALIDLNAGLRDWAGGVDEGLSSLARAVNGVKQIADDARKAAAAANESLALEVEDRRDDDDDLDEIVDDRLEAVEARIDETARLAMSIRERLDEFEKLASGMRQLPKAIEGTVAQALRRAMAARAKLDHEAETAMDETLGAVDEQLDALNEAISQISTSDDQLRKIALGQIELANRIESMQEAFFARLDAVEGRAPVPAAVPKPKPAKRAPVRKPTPRTKRRPPEDGEQ